jgi:glutamate/tyrosine decarboxylase-like PLP-dependent enzyme
VTEYFAGVSQLRVFPKVKGGDVTRLLGSTLPLEGEPLEKLVEDCRAIINSSRHNGHPRFSAYVASPATAPGAFADLIASSLNPSVTSWRSSPAATEIEMLVVKWIGELIYYSKDAHGLLTSGGSMANLLGLLLAQRSRSDGNASREGLWNGKSPMVIYASEQVHMSIPKAADILGIGRNHVRLVETDQRFRVRPDKLRVQTILRRSERRYC